MAIGYFNLTLQEKVKHWEDKLQKAKQSSVPGDTDLLSRQLQYAKQELENFLFKSKENTNRIMRVIEDKRNGT